MEEDLTSMTDKKFFTRVDMSQVQEARKPSSIAPTF